MGKPNPAFLAGFSHASDTENPYHELVDEAAFRQQSLRSVCESVSVNLSTLIHTAQLLQSLEDQRRKSAARRQVRPCIDLLGILNIADTA
ncbi:hypothetical protein MASR1M90_22700 [Desulfovibrionales bacterium]